MQHRRWLLSVMLVFALTPIAAAAQGDQRCFPETGQCISGRIRAFWEQNGGLPVFGYPTGAQSEIQIEGKPFQAQLFERNRLELHPENQRPYDVLLGRLGADRLAQQGRDPFTFPKSGAQPGCRFFPETEHNVCGDILAAWRASGLEFDGKSGKSEAESLALFGLPLSDLQTENIQGKDYQVQWFERARFELHPENAPPYNVLLGLLGNEIRDNGGAAPPPSLPAGPTPVAPPPSAPAPSGTCSQNAPVPAEGAQAWMTVTDPARRSNTTLCVRLIVGGQPINGAHVTATAHYKSTDSPLGPATTGGDGVAAITFSVGGASPGFTVDVNVTITNGGQTYQATTSFTPQ
jgi:hypothetical protein